MNVGHIITRPPVTVPSGSTLLEAAKQMVKRNVGLLVVCNARDRTKFVGVVSERDIIKSIVAGKKLATHVDSISTTRVVTVRSTSDVAEAAKAMNKHKIRHVVVVDNRGRLTGVVSMRDLVGERATLAAILQSHEKEVFVGGD